MTETFGEGLSLCVTWVGVQQPARFRTPVGTAVVVPLTLEGRLSLSSINLVILVDGVRPSNGGGGRRAGGPFQERHLRRPSLDVGRTIKVVPPYGCPCVDSQSLRLHRKSLVSGSGDLPRRRHLWLVVYRK